MIHSLWISGVVLPWPWVSVALLLSFQSNLEWVTFVLLNGAFLMRSRWHLLPSFFFSCENIGSFLSTYDCVFIRSRLHRGVGRMAVLTWPWVWVHLFSFLYTNSHGFLVSLKKWFDFVVSWTWKLSSLFLFSFKDTFPFIIAKLLRNFFFLRT